MQREDIAGELFRLWEMPDSRIGVLDDNILGCRGHYFPVCSGANS